MAGAQLAAALVAAVPAVALSGAPNTDWGRFGYDAARHNVSPDAKITAQNVSTLVRRQVQLDGTVDSSPIYVRGRFVVTTTYGRTEALNADTGKVIWRFTPSAYSRLAGSAQITNATPVASTDRTAVYAAAPDGRIRKLRLSDGKVLWTTSITRDPTHEKITSSLNVSRGLVIATTGGYIGDAPPYQGHVVTMSEKTGRIAHVWNSLCSNRRTLIVPAHLPVERFRDLVAQRCGSGSGERQPRRRDRQRSLQRQHRLGRQRDRALPGRVADAAPLDAGRPEAAEHGRSRPRLHEPGSARRRLRRAGREGRQAAAAAAAPAARA